MEPLAGGRVLSITDMQELYQRLLRSQQNVILCVCLHVCACVCLRVCVDLNLLLSLFRWFAVQRKLLQALLKV